VRLKVAAALLSMTLCLSQLGFSDASHAVHMIGSQTVGVEGLEGPTTISSLLEGLCCINPTLVVAANFGPRLPDLAPVVDIGEQV
jgi:hypothetical protein